MILRKALAGLRSTVFQPDIHLILISMVQRHGQLHSMNPQHIDYYLYQNKLPRVEGKPLEQQTPQ
jgi:hypothetical protein